MTYNLYEISIYRTIDSNRVYVAATNMEDAIAYAKANYPKYEISRVQYSGVCGVVQP